MDDRQLDLDPRAARERTRKRRIAIVDEDVWRVRSLGDALRAAGYRPLSFTSARSALVTMVSEPWDVVIAPQRMKEMTGQALFQAAREQSPRESAPALVLLVRGVLDTGPTVPAPDATLEEPYDGAQLAGIVDALVAPRALHRDLVRSKPVGARWLRK